MMRKSILLSVLFSFMIFISFLISCISIQHSLSSKVLRLHILANSDSAFDQELKLKVRDDIVKFLTPKLKNSSNLTETKEIIRQNLSEIQLLAEKITLSNSNHKASVFLDTSVFPTKHYGNISFPAGNYEALKIVIGEGKGNNWWCVMFPPLCFTDSSAGTFEEENQEKLESNLSEEEYNLVNNSKKKDVKVKFKLLEWWNSQ